MKIAHNSIDIKSLSRKLDHSLIKTFSFSLISLIASISINSIYLYSIYKKKLLIKFKTESSSFIYKILKNMTKYIG
jgi:hypothetical protein